MWGEPGAKESITLSFNEVEQPTVLPHVNDAKNLTVEVSMQTCYIGIIYWDTHHLRHLRLCHNNKTYMLSCQGPHFNVSSM